MPAASAAHAITPSRASISRTRWPLPKPPIAGLQDISPMVAKRWVTRAVRAPQRAAAVAASHPAWPPPMTTTSNFIGGSLFHVKHLDTRSKPRPEAPRSGPRRALQRGTKGGATIALLLD